MSTLEVLRKDLKQALRMFRKQRAFSLAAIAALTLGIGANTAIFSVVNAVLLRPVDLPDAERLVLFMNVTPQGSGQAASPAKFAHWSRQTEVTQDAAAFRNGTLNYTGGTLPEQLQHAQVSENFFKLFGAPFAMGRGFTSDEDIPNGPKVAVLSRGLWERLLNSDQNAVGNTISIGGTAHVIVGVLGEFSFREFGAAPEIFTPFQLDPNSTDQGHYFAAAARLVPGVSLEQAQARLDASGQEFRARFPDALFEGNSFSVETIRELLVRDVRTSLFVFAGAVGFVLLIACANVANLLLARATTRAREIAVRAAVGGTRSRIIRQLLTESVLLSLIGGVCGLALGLAGIRALLVINTAGLPRVGEGGALVTLDWRVAAFAFAVSIATGVIFGLIPAIQGSRSDLATAFKEGGGRAGSGRQTFARSALVVTEVGLALVLLVGSALLIRTAVALGNVDPGFDATNVLTMRTSLSSAKYATAASSAQLVRSGIERIQALPGVEKATTSCCVPLQGGYGLPFVISGRPLEGPAHGAGGWMTVSPGYFEVFHIPVRRGRAFTDQDDQGGPPAVMINETMARQFWPEADPLNSHLVIGRGVMREFADEPERQIIGIVGDTRDGGLNADPQPRMYVLSSQLPDAVNALNVGLTPLAWIVRTRSLPTESVTRAVQDALAEVTGLPVSGMRPMDEIVSLSISRQQFNMWLMTVFGGVALLLAAIGIYGLMAYSVSQRTQEMGIRLALGAQAAQVRNLVVWQGMRLAGIGVVVGLAAAFGLARFMTTFLFEVSERDPLVFTAVPVILVLVAGVAVYLPARRASRLDPLDALRHE